MAEAAMRAVGGHLATLSANSAAALSTNPCPLWDLARQSPWPQESGILRVKELAQPRAPEEATLMRGWGQPPQGAIKGWGWGDCVCVCSMLG